MKIAFLHTSPVHIDTFNSLFENHESYELIHEVHEDWLAEAISSGLSEGLRLQVHNKIAELDSVADVTICTCSSLGSVAEHFEDDNIFRIDGPMMREAASNSPVLLVMCLQSTVGPSSVLLEQAFKANGSEPKYQTLLCADAWAHFESNDQRSFGRAIASAVKEYLSNNDNIQCVVLAQASMRVAEKYLEELPIAVLSSPELAVKKAMTFT